MHPTLGMNLRMCPHRNQPQLISYEPSTPAIRISKWRSQPRYSYITKLAGVEITDVQDIEKVVRICRAKKYKETHVYFATIDKIAMHPQKGTPQLYHDQLNIVGKHL